MQRVGEAPLEARPVGRLQADGDIGSFAFVPAFEHVAVLIEPGDGGTVAGVDGEAHDLFGAGDAPIDGGEQVALTLAGQCRNDDRGIGADRLLGDAVAFLRIEQVDLVQATSWVGSSEMKPTVSDRMTWRRDGSLTTRIVGSSVANNWSRATTCAAVSRLNSVDLPALV